jgi:hypothetical protein
MQRQIEQHRKGTACVQVRDSAGRPCAAVPVWVEQESHAFEFGCVAPAVESIPERDRDRCTARLREVFNRITDSKPDASRVDVPDEVHLGRFRAALDRLASTGHPLTVYVRGTSVGLGADGPDVDRVAELYTLCLAHPAVRGVYWTSVWDGEDGVFGSGLLRHDFAPRRAFRYLQKLIGTVWHTRAGGETDGEGRFGFRGFFGDYRIAARIGDAWTAAVIPFGAGQRQRSPSLSLEWECEE